MMGERRMRAAVWRAHSRAGAGLPPKKLRFADEASNEKDVTASDMGEAF